MDNQWAVCSSKEIFRTGFFRFRSDECKLPDGRVMPNYYVLEFPDWVNVIPVTRDNRIVLIEQYRHAAKQLCLEVPGGSTHPGPTKEDPVEAAKRELLEETGFASDEIRLVGSHYPNPALQNNLMHTYIAYGCHKVAEPNLDPFEDIRVVTYSIPETINLAMSGKINHSIIIASLFYALPHLGFSLPQEEAPRK